MSTKRIISLNRSEERKIAAYCLQIAGGGYNPRDVAKAIEYQRTLIEHGELTVGKVKLVLTSPEEITP